MDDLKNLQGAMNEPSPADSCDKLIEASRENVRKIMRAIPGEAWRPRALRDEQAIIDLIKQHALEIAAEILAVRRGKVN